MVTACFRRAGACSRLLAPVCVAHRLFSRAVAVPIVFTTNAVINNGDFQYDGQDIVVQGCTVTINGAHSFNSLTIERSSGNQPGVVTHAAGLTAGTRLTIVTNLMVQGASGGQTASRVDVHGRGHAAGFGPGAGGYYGNRGSGGGHGGRGGNNAFGRAGGAPYGSDYAPTDLGSGGGGLSEGGAGGGAIHLVVGGPLTIVGQVSADGRNAADCSGGGGGWEAGAPGSRFFGSGSVVITQNPASQTAFIG